MAPRILKPLDWQEVGTDGFDLVVDGVDAALEARLWGQAEFFGGPAEGRRMLASAAVRPVGGGLGHGRFAGLRAWGNCVITLHPPGAPAMVAASGVCLGDGVGRNWLGERLELSAEQARAGLVPHAPVVGCALSHIPGERVERVAEAASLPELLASDAEVTALPLLRAEVVDAGAVLDDHLVLGPFAGRAGALLAASPYRASVPYVAAMRDVMVALPSGLVMPGGGRIWSDSTHAAFWLDAELRQYPFLFRTERGIGLVPDRVLGEAELLEENGLEALPGVPLLAFGNAWRNHGHWLCNTVFAAWLLRDAIRAGAVCVLVPELSPYVVDTLRAAGVPRRAMVVARPGLYRLRRALFPSTLSIHANQVPPRALGAMFRDMAGTVAQRGPAGPELVYVTRHGAATQRTMGNEAALIAALRERGFTVIAPHLLGVEAEIRAFGRARVVVGQLGAGLMNVGFAPPGCRVVEICSNNYALNDVWFECAVLGHRFSRVMVPGGSDEELRVTPFQFDVPLAAVLSLVDDVLRRMPG